MGHYTLHHLSTYNAERLGSTVCNQQTIIRMNNRFNNMNIFKLKCLSGIRLTQFLFRHIFQSTKHALSVLYTKYKLIYNASVKQSNRKWYVNGNTNQGCQLISQVDYIIKTHFFLLASKNYDMLHPNKMQHTQSYAACIYVSLYLAAVSSSVVLNSRMSK